MYLTCSVWETEGGACVPGAVSVAFFSVFVFSVLDLLLVGGLPDVPCFCAVLYRPCLLAVDEPLV